MEGSRFTAAAGVVLLVLSASLTASAREVLTPEEQAERELEAKKRAPPVLAVEPAGFRMEIKEDETRTVRLRVRNAGGRKLMWSVSSAPRWITFDVRGGDLGFDEQRSLILTVDPAGTTEDALSGRIAIEAADAEGSPAGVPVVVAILRPPKKKPEAGASVLKEPPPSAGRDARDARRSPAAREPVLPPARGFRWDFVGGYRHQEYYDEFYDLDGLEVEAVYHFRPVLPGKYPVNMAAFAHRVPWIGVRFQQTQSVETVPFDESREEIEANVRYAAKGRPLTASLRLFSRDIYWTTVDEIYEQEVLLLEGTAGYFVGRTMSVAVLLGAHEAYTWYDDYTQPGTEIDSESRAIRWGGVVEGLIPFAGGKALGIYARYRNVKAEGSTSSTHKLRFDLDYYVNPGTSMGLRLRSNIPGGGTATNTIGITSSWNPGERFGLETSFELQGDEHPTMTTMRALLVLRM